MTASELKELISEALSRSDGRRRAAGPPGERSSILDYLCGDGEAARSLPSRSLLYLFGQIYGAESTLKCKLERLHALCDLFLNLYGDGPISILRAPARINILGEHVDYVSYLATASLPFGSREHDMIMLCRASHGAQVRGASSLAAFAPFDFDLNDGPPPAADQDLQRQWVSYLQNTPPPVPHWGAYVKGSVFFARLKYGERIRSGFDFVVDSSIPPGGGASSSSALIMLGGAAIRWLNLIAYAPEELAHDSAQAEWYVGTRGGAMDHLTICLARKRAAVHISYSESQAELIPMPDQQFRWVTFFSHKADKGREVMLEYNERAAVSRLIIPAMIEDWSRRNPELYRRWKAALEEFRGGSLSALEVLRRSLDELPDEITLAGLERNYADAFRQCQLNFPTLVRDRLDRPLKVRDRALHHIGEVWRVARAVQIFRDLFQAQITGSGASVDAGMRAIGELLDESHQSLCELYEVCTPEVNRLVEIILSDSQVYGARLMGGGFGGNVLALIKHEHLPSLVDRIQSKYYGPRGREGVAEGSVMVSTPGAGLAIIDIESVWREAITEFNARWWEAARDRQMICSLLDRLDINEAPSNVWPVIVAAGKGTRAAASGLNVPKPLALVSGIPSIARVLRTVKAAARRPPIVIVSPETEKGVRQALAGEEVIYIVQPVALGTGDAVLCAYEQMRGFEGRALVVWGTQPVIHPTTVRRTQRLGEFFADYKMILPTAVINHPYAPLRRDNCGQVRASQETHLESAQAVRFGETNIGLFNVNCDAMFETLLAVRRDYWRESEGRYELRGGELGFPNEVITRLARLPNGVLASPIADWREQQGIKSREDIARCEQFINEMEQEARPGAASGL